MVVINTTDDLIRLLKEDPVFLEAARRELLTEELLSLPDRFAAYAAATDKKLDALTSDVGELKTDVATLKTDVSELKVDVATLKTDVSELKVDVATLKTDVGVLKSDNATLKTDVSTLKTDSAFLKGVTFQASMEKSGLPRMASQFRLRNVRIVRLAEYNRASQEFNDDVLRAFDDGVISEYEYDRLMLTDMIVRGRIGKAAQSFSYLVAEASYTAESDDITKVGDSAAALRKIFREDDVLPCLYCVNINDSLLEIAKDKGVNVFISAPL